MARSLNLNRWYKCPDCGEEVHGYELQTGDKEAPYVCPGCGCLQENRVIEQQLGKVEE